MNKEKPKDYWLRLYEWYGKYVLKYNFFMIVLPSLIMFFTIYFMVADELITPLLIANGILFAFNHQIVQKIAENEIYPNKIFQQYSLSWFFLKWSIVGVTMTVVMVLIVGFLSILDVFSPIIGILLWSFVVFLSLVFVTSIFQLSLPRLKAHKRARLCFKIVIKNLEQVVDKDEKERQKMTAKYVKYLKNGLRAFNEYLFKIHGFEIADIDSYYSKAYKTALIGNKKELEKTVEYLNEAFSSIGVKEKEDELRDFLIAMYHVRRRTNKKSVSTTELLKMTRTLSRMDKIKPKITSPYILPLITAIISLTLMILDILKTMTAL